MHSLASHRELSKHSECRFARGSKPVLARAVRPLAASARPKCFGAGCVRCAEPALSIEQIACLPAHNLLKGVKKPMFGKAVLALRGDTAFSEKTRALRRSAKPNTRGCAATSFARGGGFGLFSAGATQRTMRAGSVPQGALPNPSINRTSSGKPAAACYLKR